MELETIHHLIVIASSAGGIAPLIEVISKLPKGPEAAVIVVQHLSANKNTGLPELLNRMKFRIESQWFFQAVLKTGAMSCFLIFRSRVL